MADEKRQWVIRDVPDRTRRTVNKWAGEWDVSVAEALARLVDKGDRAEAALVSMRTTGEIEGVKIVRTDEVSQLEELAEMVADLIEKRKQQDDRAE